MRTLSRYIIALFLALGVFDALAAEKPYTETSGRDGWYLFRRPRKKKPADQLAYADKLLEQGKERRAMRHYLALTRFWPESPEAAVGQYKYARLMDHRGNMLDAFDEYQRLFDRYTGLFPYDEVLNRQFELAGQIMNRRKGRFLFFPGFAAPERAAPLYEKIVGNGPQWEKAPEAQYLMGQAYEQALEYEQAIACYMVTQQRYPDSPFAAKASFRTAYCFYLLAQESPNNKQVLDNAWAALMLFLNTHPMAEDVAVAREYSRTLLRQRARLAYNTAIYYDRVEKRPAAALIAYQTLVREFPQSDWTEPAKLRIEALSKQVESKP